jgi:Mrp family chromosome partitioning ATPase
MSRNFELLQQAGVMFPGAGKLPAEAKAPSSGGGRKLEPRSFPTERYTTSTLPADLDRSVREETLRLVQSVFLLQSDEDRKVVVFAAVDSGSGCSRVCVHAAQVLAASVPGSVCLVDANFRQPSLPEALGIAGHPGLADALRSEGGIRDFVAPVRDQNLWLLSSGSDAEGGRGLLHSDRMRERMAELRYAFDYVVVDAPPLNAYSEGVALGQFADGLVLVLEANTTRRDATARIAERLAAMQVKVLGAVLNKRTFPIPDSLYRRL